VSRARALVAEPIDDLGEGWRSATGDLREAAVRRSEGAGALVSTWISELRKPRLLRSGLAAAERGNLDAAFALLREASDLRPQHKRTALAFWDVALCCERADAAAESLARVVQREALAGDRGAAVEHWISLMSAAPAAVLDAASLARMLPELKARMVGSSAPEAREEARSWLLTALRQCLDPRGGGLTPGLALRIFEESRALEPEVARRAARVVLDSPDLHETKRARVEALLAALDDPPQPPASPADADDAPGIVPPLVVIDVMPVELTDRALLLLEIDSEQRTRVDFRAVEAIAVAEVEEGAATFLLVDLVLQRSRRRAPRRVLRLREDRFDAKELFPDEPDAEQALRHLLSELLERTHAIPLPDPDSALGLRPSHFDGLAAYQTRVLDRLRR
jgi:hypothetical protein